MDILKTAIDWTKAEMFSSAFFILFGLVFLSASIGFWQIGKTEVAKAFIIPTLIAGGLLLIIGLGIFIQSFDRVTSFVDAYNSNATAFVASEIERAKKVLNDYRIAVFRVIPIIVTCCAVLILFLDTPIWRASLITIIAMMSTIMIIDTNANARLENYQSDMKGALEQK